MDEYNYLAPDRNMKRLDMNSEYLGVSRRLLMENAGRELSRACSGSNIAVFCGCGNNGGDGFAAARHLSSAGKKVRVYAVYGTRTEDAQKNLEIVEKLPSIKLEYVRDSSDCEAIEKGLKECDTVVDALLGVGVKGEIREPIKSLVAAMNRSKAEKIAADVPTPGFKADRVVSFHNAKTPNAFVVNIGIPTEADSFCGPGDVYCAIPERTGAEHKGDFGRLLVIGGSKDYVGAPILTAKAAYRTGADLVTIACPGYAARYVSDPVLIIRPLSLEDHLSGADVDGLLKVDCDSVVIGNGMGLHEETRSFVREFLRKTDKPAVLDADALKLIEPRHIRPNHIITPMRGNIRPSSENFLRKGRSA